MSGLIQWLSLIWVQTQGLDRIQVLENWRWAAWNSYQWNRSRLWNGGGVSCHACKLSNPSSPDLFSSLLSTPSPRISIIKQKNSSAVKCHATLFVRRSDTHWQLSFFFTLPALRALSSANFPECFSNLLVVNPHQDAQSAVKGLMCYLCVCWLKKVFHWRLHTSWIVQLKWTKFLFSLLCLSAYGSWGHPF